MPAGRGRPRSSRRAPAREGVAQLGLRGPASLPPASAKGLGPADAAPPSPRGGQPSPPCHSAEEERGRLASFLGSRGWRGSGRLLAPAARRDGRRVPGASSSMGWRRSAAAGLRLLCLLWHRKSRRRLSASVREGAAGRALASQAGPETARCGRGSAAPGAPRLPRVSVPEERNQRGGGAACPGRGRRAARGRAGVAGEGEGAAQVRRSPVGCPALR